MWIFILLFVSSDCATKNCNNPKKRTRKVYLEVKMHLAKLPLDFYESEKKKEENKCKVKDLSYEENVDDIKSLLKYFDINLSNFKLNLEKFWSAPVFLCKPSVPLSEEQLVDLKKNEEAFFAEEKNYIIRKPSDDSSSEKYDFMVKRYFVSENHQGWAFCVFVGYVRALIR